MRKGISSLKNATDRLGIKEDPLKIRPRYEEKFLCCRLNRMKERDTRGTGGKDSIGMGEWRRQMGDSRDAAERIPEEPIIGGEATQG